MGRFILLVGICLVIIGTLITLKVPMSWIGHLPGDCSYSWGNTRIYIPITTSLVFSLVVSVLLFIFARR